MTNSKLIISAAKLALKQLQEYKGNKGNFRFQIKKKYPKFFNYINQQFGDSFSQKLYNLANEIKETPLCQYCNKNKVKFQDTIHGYKKYCSYECAKKDPNLVKRRQETLKEKYGVTSMMQLPEISKKVQEKNKEHFSKDGEGRKKYIKTMQEKYGIVNPMEKDEFREKISSTWKEKTQEELKIIDFKRKETNQKIHNTPNFNNSEKRQETLKEKYNVNHIGQLNSSKEFLEFSNKPNKKSLLEEMLKEKHPLKIADELKTSYSTIYKLIRDLDLKDKIRKTFIGETEIAEFIKGLGFKIETNNRTILNGKELDILIPEKNLAIEFNGLYWHSELNGKDRNYHLNKTLLAEEKGYQLIHIFEDEWLFKKEIVKSVLKAKLGITTRIFARKTKIKELTTKEKDEFLENNHLQGKDNPTVKLGLFYNDELVSVMTFGKPRFNKNYQYEMHRFANKINTSVVGGASKLFKYFIRNYNPSSVITYADRRYSKGVTYPKLGFTLKSISKPNFFILEKGLKRVHRMKYQKHKQKDILEFFDQNKTAWQNMVENGYDRIWDCGNYVFSWKNVK